MEREGIKISRKLLSQWVVRTGMALKPLYEEMLKHILKSQNIFIDETPVKLWEPNQCKQAFMWVVVGGNESNPPYRIYDFRENRCHDNVLDILKDYRGILHSDKYGAYEKLAQSKTIIWCPCWGHIRRKFFEAEGGDPEFRQWVLRKMRYPFMLERVAWARSAEVGSDGMLTPLVRSLHILSLSLPSFLQKEILFRCLLQPISCPSTITFSSL